MQDRDRRRTFHGRRRGKALRASQLGYLREILPRLVVRGVPAWPGDPLFCDTGDAPQVDPAALFPDGRPIWLEIGFGGGEHLHALACRHPEIGLIGCEPFVNGVAALLGKVAEHDPGNVRVHPGDVRDLTARLPSGAIDRVYLLYPDPWPKARHRKRRYVTPEGLANLARIMAPGAELRLATDIADYAEHAVESAAALPALLEPVTTAAPDWWQPWEGWTGTRYEVKARAAKRRPHYLVWRRC